MFESINAQHPVVVLGMGQTGLSLVRYCLKKSWPCIVCDTRDNPANKEQFMALFPELDFYFGDLDESLLLNAGLILLSPGVDSNIPSIKSAKQKGVVVISDIELFFKESSQPLIGVTGSNGKSTVCDCLGWVLSANNCSNKVMGNIGVPVLESSEHLASDRIVLELSSFQLDLVNEFKVDVACVLNVSEDHLDRHKTMARYIEAKQRIYRGARVAVFNADDSMTYPKHQTQKALSFGMEKSADYRVISTPEGFQIVSAGHEGSVLLLEANTKLKGLHNGLNFAACLAILEGAGIPSTSEVLRALESYTGLEHRCEIVPTNDGVLWINDSKATNLGSAIAAINGFHNSKSSLYLVAGGDAKGADLSPLSELIKEKVKNVFVFGKDKHLFSSILSQDVCQEVDDLAQAIQCARNKAIKGDTVLFSPACASLDMYPNYIARGNHFRTIVLEGERHDCC